MVPDSYSHRRHCQWLTMLICLLLATAQYADADEDTNRAATSPQQAAATDSTPTYNRDIQPILDRRCVVCHGCYDAPCQLKLSSADGLLRGASGIRVYDGARLLAAEPTRLFFDAQSVNEWRQLEFHPVLQETGGATDQSMRVLVEMLKLKQQHPLPEQAILPDSFDFSLSRDQQCTTAEKFPEFAEKYPLWGMPYGLPAIPDEEYETLMSWLDNGAVTQSKVGPPADLLDSVNHWENYLNGDSLKQQLISRYLYEHLFLANLYFEDRGQETAYFRLVRSRTPPGVPLSVIATRLPYDDPNEERVFYRFMYNTASIVDKTHMPYLLDKGRMEKWQTWFNQADFSVKTLPGYDVEIAGNPFLVYKAIPSERRYRFLLDEAEFTIMNFIKGSVCRGAVALNVIPDRFWVFFVAPGVFNDAATDEFFSEQSKDLKLPVELMNKPFSIVHWHKYADAQHNYLVAKGDFIRAQQSALSAMKMELIWDGGGTNPNAALTVFRHYDSATVVKGLVGQPPKTAWLVDYTVLERIHYLLVAGFDVFGNVSHQAMTRMYMDFLRMESELNFLALLPWDVRKQEMEFWYRDAYSEVTDLLADYLLQIDATEPLLDNSPNPKLELYRRLKEYLAPVLDHHYELKESGLSGESLAALETLNKVKGAPATNMAQTTFINVQGHGLLTLVSNNAYSNIASMFNEESRRLPNEDTFTLVNGLLGAYPNVFLQVDESQIPALVTAIRDIRDEKDYRKLLDRFGIRRSDSHFWQVSDQIQEKYRLHQPLKAGILDYNRLENR